MASKVNTKFLMYLVIAIGVATMLVGGLYVLNVRGNVARNMRLGDEAVQAGDLQKAYDYYGRAVHKEPGNLEYLAKLEAVVLQLQPKTSDEAVQLYRAWLGVLQHAARHDATNEKAHLRLLHELYSTGRQLNSQWEALGSAAKDMWERLPETNPDRPTGKIFQSIATFRRPALSTLEEMTAAERDMQTVVTTMPNDDLAWATLAHGQIVLAEKMIDQGRRGSVIDEQYAKVDETLQQALQAVPDGIETARVHLIWLLMRRSMDSNAVNEDQIAQAADKLEALLHADVDPGLLSESVEALGAVPNGGDQRAIALLSRYLEQHPKSDEFRLSFASLSYMTDQLDTAEQAARRVIEAEPMPVSFLAQLQPDLRKGAASLIVDIESRRWSQAPMEERVAHVQAMERAREKVREFVADEANDLQLIRADARIAFAKGNYARAAQHFERLVRETGMANDAEMLFYAAATLENLNQIGLAHERIMQALKLRPGALPLLMAKARLEFNMGRREDAAATIALISESDRELEEVRRLAAAIESAPKAAAAATAQTPLQIEFSKANEALAKGDVDTARTIITSLLSKSPNDLALLRGMIMLELRVGQTEQAREYLTRAMAIEPENQELIRLQALLKHDDPIEAMREYHKVVTTNEAERALAMLGSLRSISIQQERQAQQLESAKDVEGADKARQIASRAKVELKTYFEQAQRLMPNDSRFMEYQLDDAMLDKDWSRAEQVAARAATLDSDQANGMFFRGRLELAKALDHVERGNSQEARALYQQAIRSLEAATERLSFSSTAWRALAFAYQNFGNLAQAERAFEQAYKCNPNDLECVRAYLDLLLRRGEPTRALRILQSAHQLAPNDVQLRNLWLQVEAESGDRALALRMRRELYKTDPTEAVNAAELARLLSRIRIGREVILDASGNPVYSEQRWTRMSVEERDQAIVQAKTQMYKESDEILNKLSTQLSDDLRLAVLRASMLRDRGEITSGAQVLRDFIARQGEGSTTAEMLIELGRYYVRSNRPDDAIETFQRAIALQNPNKREADHELSQLYMQIDAPDKAVEHLKKVLEVAADRSTQNQLVESLLKMGRFDEAEQRLQEVIASSGEDYMTSLLSSSIAEGRGDELLSKEDAAGAERMFAKHRDALSRAQTQDPLSPTPKLLLARSFLKEFRRSGRASLLDDALHALQDADKLRAGMPEISMVRVGVLRAKGDTIGAIGELRRLVERAPELLSARRELIQMYADNRQLDEALAMIEDGIRSNPMLSVWHEAKGDLYVATNRDTAVALDAYRRACDISPAPLLLMKIADTTFAQPTPDCKALAARLSARTEELAKFPVLREAYARALMCMHRRDEALEQLRLAYARRQEMIQEELVGPADISRWYQALAHIYKRPGTTQEVDASAAEQFAMEIAGPSLNVHELRALAKLWLVSGDPKLGRAIEMHRQAMDKASPDDKQLQVELGMELATYYYASKNPNDAAAAYEAVIQVDPEHQDALNNAAYLIAVDLKDPSRAVGYADRALKVAPENAAVLDTVGWVYFLTGDHEKGKQFLLKSLELQRTAGTCVHLAEASLKTNDLAAARRYLEDAAKLNPDAQARQAISRLEADIQSARTSGQ